MNNGVLKTVGMLIALMSVVPMATARHHRHREDTAAGQFDYYLLSLSWSPAFCLQQPGSAECNGPRRLGFIVHGLWPQNERGWPSNCGGTADVPDDVVDGITDLMPAKKLIYHEWTTHGTCSGLDPDAYFALVRRARSSVALPPELTRTGAAIQQRPADVVSAFMRVNPGLPADAVVATCSGQDVPRLREVHVCFDRALRPRGCSADALREACRADSIVVPPIR